MSARGWNARMGEWCTGACRWRWGKEVRWVDVKNAEPSRTHMHGNFLPGVFSTQGGIHLADIRTDFRRLFASGV